MSAGGSQIENLLENVELKQMLDFETQIFLDLVHNDGLVVASKYESNSLQYLYLHKNFFKI